MNGAEYDNYGKQYQTFQKIIAVYDTEPDNFPRYVSCHPVVYQLFIH